MSGWRTLLIVSGAAMLLVALSLLAVNCAPKQTLDTKDKQPFGKWLPKRTELGMAGRFKVVKEGAEEELLGATYYITVGEESLAVSDESMMNREGYRQGCLGVIPTESLKKIPAGEWPRVAALVVEGAPRLELEGIPSNMATAANDIVALANEVLTEEEVLGEFLPDSAVRLIRTAAKGDFILSQDYPFVSVRRSVICFHDIEVVRLFAGSVYGDSFIIDLYIWSGDFALIYRGGNLTTQLLITGISSELEATPAKGADVSELKQHACGRVRGILDYVCNAAASGLVNLTPSDKEAVVDVIRLLEQDARIKWRRPAAREDIDRMEKIERLWL